MRRLRAALDLDDNGIDLHAERVKRLTDSLKPAGELQALTELCLLPRAFALSRLGLVRLVREGPPPIGYRGALQGGADFETWSPVAPGILNWAAAYGAGAMTLRMNERPPARRAFRHLLDVMAEHPVTPRRTM
jgi:hypothetical protein